MGTNNMSFGKTLYTAQLGRHDKVNTHLIDVLIDESWGNNTVFGNILQHSGHIFPLNELQLSGVVATAGQCHGGEGIPVWVVLLSGLVVEGLRYTGNITTKRKGRKGQSLTREPKAKRKSYLD
ncbi:hypothetical protein E2C01_027078 [Portunus trituberculatus]|uniref:Uncharacterized protein n=1 Tax=Portunus trituberculatus TaxID=210409 RepID=A0A5B7EKP6_PORTR|nr:hypothetical protein [Portunus trituberculatus]